MIDIPEIKTDYRTISLKEIENLPKDKKPTILLHACCGPCSCYPLLFLCPYFDVTIYFNNANIYPQEEYIRRLEELKKLLSYYRRDYGYDVKLIVTNYNNSEYMVDLEPYKDQREGLDRCQLCYTKRMAEAFDYAENNGFDYFTTVMTISRQKSSQIMNLIGEKLAKSHKKTKYFFSDFKKGGGQETGREMRLKYDLYNQTYCGCQYSYESRLAYDNTKKEAK